MDPVRYENSQRLIRAAHALREMAKDAPTLDGSGSRRVEAWFLGPKAENAELLERLVVEAVRDQAFWRRNYHPEDPTHVTEEIKRTPEYGAAVDATWEGLRELLAFLKRSVPFFSMRYQGHMNWDLTLPSIAGYFAALLYNPNNVAFEGSTATTILELLVGDDLCQMLGYTLPKSEAEIRPWGHITCDGTVANIEAMWAARNLKYFALAFQEALRDEPALAAGRKLEVEHPAVGRKALLDLTPWEAINLSQDSILELSGRLTQHFGIRREDVSAALDARSLQALGLVQFARRFSGVAVGDSAIQVSGTKHYSFPKAAALLGLGNHNLIDVPVDLDARLDLDELRMRLDDCLAKKRPVLAVIAVIGTTEESAIDPVAEVIDLRNEYERRGLSFHVHADAAWGGYHRSVINQPFNLPSPLFVAAPIEAPLSRYSHRQLASLGGTDSITVDPHKSGYIPYPAGALCYRNAAMRDLLTFSAPVVFHGGAEPTVGIYGVEGSKPGAAAASAYLSHRVIRPTREGYGAIIGQALFSCRKLYARLLSLARPEDPFLVMPIARLPVERTGGSDQAVAAERKLIAQLIDRADADDIRGNADAFSLLQEIGPDENILAYAFNFKSPQGKVNPDLRLANQLNRAIYDRLSIDPGKQIYGYDLIVSTTDLDGKAYGRRFLDDYKRRLGVGGSAGDEVTVIRSVVMDPWVTETSQGSFIDVLERELRKAVLAAIEIVQPIGVSGR